MSEENNKELQQPQEEEKEESKTMINGKSSKKLKELVLPNDSNVAKGNV